MCPVPSDYMDWDVSLSFSGCPRGKGMTPPPPHQQNRTAKPPWLGKDGAPAFTPFRLGLSLLGTPEPLPAFLKWERMSQEFAHSPLAGQARAAVVIRVLMAL